MPRFFYEGYFFSSTIKLSDLSSYKIDANFLNGDKNKLTRWW